MLNDVQVVRTPEIRIYGLFLAGTVVNGNEILFIYVVKVTNGRWSQVADGYLAQMAIGHFGPGSNVQSSNLMINLLMIGCLSLGLNGRWPFESNATYSFVSVQ